MFSFQPGVSNIYMYLDPKMNDVVISSSRALGVGPCTQNGKMGPPLKLSPYNIGFSSFDCDSGSETRKGPGWAWLPFGEF